MGSAPRRFKATTSRQSLDEATGTGTYARSERKERFLKEF
jgi:hypothetical protein